MIDASRQCISRRKREITMETITQYINALFAKMPASLEILHLRDAVLEQARAAFVKLRENGMDESTAVGTVLASMGSLDDILARNGMKPTAPQPVQDAPEPDTEALPDDIEDYLDAQYNICRMNALGVGLCICAPIFAIFFDSGFSFLGHWIECGELGAIGLFGSVAIAVMLFIYSNSLQKGWRDFPQTVLLTAGMCRELRRREADYAAQRTAYIAAGVGLCIFSPAMGILFNHSSIGPALMFGLVAVGVFLLIISNIKASACRKLLKQV